MASTTDALGRLLAREVDRFEEEHPRSRALAQAAADSLLAGVPMPWMIRWPGGFPVFAAEAKGARFRDVDGNEYVDFCLGDTAAMTWSGLAGGTAVPDGTYHWTSPTGHRYTVQPTPYPPDDG